MVQISRKLFVAPQDARGWIPIVHDLFGAADTKVREMCHFTGEIRHGSFGSLGISSIASTNESVVRNDRHISSDFKDLYVLACVRRGSVTVKQNGRECQVNPGQIVLFDADRPVHWVHDQPAEVLNVTLPRYLMDARMRNLGLHCAKPYSSAVGTWKIVAGFVDSLHAQMRNIPDLAAHRYSNHVVDMISLALDAGSEDLPVFDSPIRLPLYKRCAAYIRANLSDENLDPSRVAVAMGISVRYLHRIFQDTEDSVSDFIRNARLEACRLDLCDTSRRGEPISEIAFRHGFRSQSYFATAFKKRYAMSARECRKQLRNAQRDMGPRLVSDLKMQPRDVSPMSF